jgi:hypothetical protein
MKRFLILGLLLIAPNLRSAEPQYTRTRDLPAMKISFADLDVALTKAFSLLSTANAQATKKEYLRESLSVGAEPDQVEIAGHAFPSTVRLPKAAYTLTYAYSWSDAPVSSLRLVLGDYTRRLTVSGGAPDQVEAISTTLERDLSQHSTFFGGSKYRTPVEALLFGILVPTLIISSAYCVVERRWRALGMPIFSLLAVVLLVTLPFEELLPGFAIYQGESSFLVRFAPQISFLGLIVSAAAIPLSYLVPRWLEKRRPQTA